MCHYLLNSFRKENSVALFFRECVCGMWQNKEREREEEGEMEKKIDPEKNPKEEKYRSK